MSSILMTLTSQPSSLDALAALTTTSFAPLCSRMDFTSCALKLGRMGTAMAPARFMARYERPQLGQLSPRIATLSPFTIPLECRKKATFTDCDSSCEYVIASFFLHVWRAVILPNLAAEDSIAYVSVSSLSSFIRVLPIFF